MPEKHGMRRILFCTALLILPVVLMVIFDPAARLSRWNLCSDIAGTLLFLDLPIAVCMLHWFRPQLFRLKNGWYSPLPWLLLTLIGWLGVAGEMYVSVLLGRGPSNGFAAFCAYFFGWAYIWVTMIPIWLLYLLLRGAVLGIGWILRRGSRKGDDAPVVAIPPQELKHTGGPGK